MKILCICNHGNVRSACLAREIKDLNGPCISSDREYIKEWIKNESIAIGVHSCNEETIKYFIDWADKVIDLSCEDVNNQDLIKKCAGDKYLRHDIGGDRWGNPFHPELRLITQKFRNEIVK